MFFRDNKTGGSLLNICHNDYTNDRLYYMALMRQYGSGSSQPTHIKTQHRPDPRITINNEEDLLPSWVKAIVSGANDNNA